MKYVSLSESEMAFSRRCLENRGVPCAETPSPPVPSPTDRPPLALEKILPSRVAQSWAILEGWLVDKWPVRAK